MASFPPRRKNGCTGKACGRFMRACGKWPTQPLCSATQMGSRAQCVRNVLPPLVDMPNDDAGERCGGWRRARPASIDIDKLRKPKAD